MSSIKYDTHNSYALTTSVTTYFDGHYQWTMRVFQISKQVIRIIFNDLVVHEVRFSYEKIGVFVMQSHKIQQKQPAS